MPAAMRLEDMEKAAAAEFLGVSTRTVERFASAGKLTKGRALRKTRPIVVFDREELEALKTELESTRPSEVFRRLNTPKAQNSIGFRLDASYVKLLASKGETLGMSPGEYARRLVIRGLEEDTAERVTAELKAFRKSLTDMFYLILVTKLDASESQAAEIVATLSGGT